MMEDLKNDRRTAEAALERRHNENKEQRGVLIQTFKEMIDILKEKKNTFTIIILYLIYFILNYILYFTLL